MQPAANVSKKAICLFCFKAVLPIAILILIVEYNSIPWNSFPTKQDMVSNTSSINMKYYLDEYPTPPKGYLVWSNSCHMPDVDPFTADAMRHFKKVNYSSCSDDEPRTQMIFDMNSQTFILRIKDNLNNNEGNTSCCYESVLRSGTGARIDEDFKLKECVPFSTGYVLPTDVDSVIIKCDVGENKNATQKDAHFLVREKPEVQNKLNSYKNRTDLPRAASVLLLGIDTMSRFNLRRTMPETTKKLLSGNWFELGGYNKIDDNTFPNLMAILTGYNINTIRDKCNLQKPGGLDDCNLIWDTFKSSGYVTAYAEDESWMSTFNYLPKGFIKEPVDYYHRPFMLAIEKNLKIKKLSGMKFCVGPRHSAEYVYDFAMQFASRFKGEPYFGLFWTNTFTHNAFSDASAMDVRIANYIDEMQDRGIMDDSIVLLFSDHGSRFGSIRSLKQGFLDERLPFIFIWLPPWFRATNPMFMNALKINRYRLTSPYDVHMTLQHLLRLSGRTEKQSKAQDCPDCQSIFFPVAAERTCKEAGIDDHWCTCTPYENIATDNPEVVRATDAVIANLNSYLNNHKLSPPCLSLKVKKIVEAQVAVNVGLNEHHANSSDSVTYRIRFSVALKTSFEASVAYSKTLKAYNILSNVSRLDAYASQSECINNKEAKKYCICSTKSPTGIKS